MIPIIGPLLELGSSLFGMGKTVVEGWQARVTARQENALKIEAAQAEAAIARAQKAQDAEINWDIAMGNQMSSSWKDEWLLGLFSIPLVMSFIPGWDVYVRNGFDVLGTTPDWYQWSLLVIVSASYGYRKLADAFDRFKK